MIYKSHDGREFRFNDIVVAESIFGLPDEGRIGRLVQVRKGVGAFGSDSFFVRLCNGTLRNFHNVMLRHASDKKFEQNYYISNDMVPPVVLPDDEYPKDDEGCTYELNGEYPECGFVIEHPAQPDDPKQVFAMRITK